MHGMKVRLGLVQFAAPYQVSGDAVVMCELSQRTLMHQIGPAVSHMNDG
jgi:hypothetical protein